MRIMLVSNLYGALARGGAERVVAEEAEALAAAGHDVAVVSSEPPRAVPKGVCLPGEPWRCPPPGTPEEVHAAYDAHLKRVTKPGAPREIRFSSPNVAFYADLGRHGAAFKLLWHAIDTWDPRPGRTLSAILGYERPDVVHTHNLMGIGFSLPAAIRRAGVRHVHTVHDVQLLDPSGLLPAVRPFRPAPHQRAYAAAMRGRMGSPDVVVFPSEFHRDLHLKLGFFPRSRHVVLRNPAPPPGAPRASAASPARFLFVGQLEPHKGIRVLLDAWAKAATGGASLEIAGGGSLEAEVRDRAATLGRVRALGRLGREALSAAYARADWLVAPSVVIENAPAALMEALGRGIPAVASSSGGIPELVREGETGFLASPGDAASLTVALGRAAGVASAEHAAMSAACVASVAGLDARHHAETLLGLYAR